MAATSADKPEGSNSGSTPFTFTVTRSGPTSGTSAVNWAVSGDGANPANPDDFAGGIFPSGTLTFAAGETSKVVTAFVRGDGNVEPDEGFKVTLNAPIGATITSPVAAGVIRNDDAVTPVVPPSLAIAATAASKPEGNVGPTPFTFTVTRSGDVAAASSARWTVSGNGSNPADPSDFGGFSFPSGTVTFAAGERSKVVTVNVAGDLAVEADEGFAVTLASPVNATISAATATGLIRNDDAINPVGPTSLTIAATSADKPEGNTGSTGFTFTVTRSGNAAPASSARWAVTGGGSSPANAADFAGGRLPTGTVSFAAGERSKVVTVTVAGDVAIEADEGFAVTLSQPVNATITAATATGVIRNDDGSAQGAVTVALGAGVADGATRAEATQAAGVVTVTGARNTTVFVNFVGSTNGAGDAKKIVTKSFVGQGPGIPLPVTLTDADLAKLTDGRVDVVAVQQDAAGTFGPNTVVSFTLDTVPPAASTVVLNGALADGGTRDEVTQPSGVLTVTGDANTIVYVNFVGSTNGVGDASKIVLKTVTGQGPGVPVPVTLTNADLVKLTDGRVEVRAVQRDAAGNWSQNTIVSFMLDTVVPAASVVVLSGALGDGATREEATQPSGVVSVTGEANTIVYVNFVGSTNGVGDASKIVLKTVTGQGPGVPVPVTLTEADLVKLTDGRVEVRAVQRDAAGNWSQNTIVSFMLDQRPTPSLSIAAVDADRPEGNAGSTTFTFTITRSGNTASASSARWVIAGGGSGLAPSDAADFVNGTVPGGVVVFAPGETSKTVTVSVAGDTAVEGDEAFTVTLADPTNATIAVGAATAIVRNDDVAVIASRIALVGPEPHGMRKQKALFTVRLLDPNGKPLAGQPLVFTASAARFGTRQLGTKVTDGDGKASIEYLIPEDPNADNITLKAEFQGTATIQKSAYSVRVQIGKPR